MAGYSFRSPIHQNDVEQIGFQLSLESCLFVYIISKNLAVRFGILLLPMRLFHGYGEFWLIITGELRLAVRSIVDRK